MQNAGYQSLESQDPSENERLQQAMLDRMVDRSLKRMEDEYKVTQEATWSAQGDPLIDQILNNLEVRLSRLEELLEAAEEQEHRGSTPVEQTKQGRERPTIATEEVKKQAKSIAVPGLSEHFGGDIASLKDLTERLSKLDASLGEPAA